MVRLYDSNVYILLQLTMGIVPWLLTFIVAKKVLKLTGRKSLGLTVMVFIICSAMTIPARVGFRSLAFQAFTIPSPGMEPTLLVGDHFLVNRFTRLFDRPSKGEVIVFQHPVDPSKDFVQRVVALGGESIEIHDKKLFVNGVLVRDDPGVHRDTDVQSAATGPRDNFGPVVVPQGSLFVMGDNRDRSLDSRFWGFVKLSDVEGKASVIYLSLDYETKTFRTERIGERIR
jgi:signal peptidase I